MKLLKILLIVLVCIGAMHLLVLLTVGLTDKVDYADAIVIFGNKVEVDGEPSQRLSSRLDEGIVLFKQNMAPLIIVSGGFGKEGFDEALVMKDYLMKNGVPEEVIITDQDGYNTYQTAKKIRDIKESKNIEKIILVSHYYHLLRARLAVSKFGIGTVYLSHAKTPPELRDLYSIPREIIGYYAYLFKSY